MFKDVFKKMVFYIPISAVIVLTWFAVSFVSAWTSPGGSPPGSNAPAPLNVSTTAQTKEGQLTLNNSLIVNGAAYFNNRANICTKIGYGEAGTVQCPANYYVTSVVDGGGFFYGGIPSSGFMICCKNAD